MLSLAVDCYRRVTQLAPRVDVGFFNLGNALFDIEQFSEAKLAYEKSLSLNPDDPSSYVNLGNACAELHEWEGAIQAFDSVLKSPNSTNSDRLAAFRNGGKVLMAMQNWREAIQNFRRAKNQFPDHLEFVVMESECYLQLAEFGPAMDSLLEAISNSPNDPLLLNQIAQVNFKRGRAMEAFLCLNQSFANRKVPTSLLSQRLQILCFCPESTPQRLLAEAKAWGEILKTYMRALENWRAPIKSFR